MTLKIIRPRFQDMEPLSSINKLTKVLLVVSWNGSFYDFPKGKVDENEDEVECAIREVQEEIGYDI